MNTPIRHGLLALLLCPALALAQSPPPPAASAPTTAYPTWEKLSPAQREILLTPLRDRWNSNPQERARMFEHARRWQAMPEAQRERARRGFHRWEQMPPDKRREARALFHATHGMDKAARHDFFKRWQAMTPPQREAWLKAHPAPEREPRR